MLLFTAIRRSVSGLVAVLPLIALTANAMELKPLGQPFNTASDLFDPLAGEPEFSEPRRLYTESGENQAELQKLPVINFKGDNSNCQVCIIGAVTYRITYSENNVRLTLSRIEVDDDSNISSTGTIRVALWATSSPYRNASSGYILGEDRLEPLSANQYYYNVELNMPYDGDPPGGCYYVTIGIDSWNGSSWTRRDWVQFDSCLIYNDVETGGCCGNSNPQPTPSPFPSPTATPFPSPTPTPPPTNAPSGDNPYSAASNLNTSYWGYYDIDGLGEFEGVGRDANGGLGLSVSNPNNGFGWWETRELEALSAGVYRIRLTLNFDSIGGSNLYPSLRFRAFPAHNETSNAAISADITSSRPQQTTLDLYWTSDGFTPWKMAIDLLSFRPENAGGIKVTNMSITRID